MPNRKAFTLIELLVVVSIIGLLVALLLPALARAREAVKYTACQANLKAIGLGVINYTIDSKSYYPIRVGLPGDHNNYQPDVIARFTPPTGVYDDRVAIRPYFSSFKCFQCPLVPLNPNLDNSPPMTPVVNAIEIAYSTFYGWSVNNVDGTDSMYKAGDHLRYAGREFNVLAMDAERYSLVWNYGAFSHPDNVSLRPYSDYAWSWGSYVNFSGVIRGPVKNNYVYDDGSVNALITTWNDASTVAIPTAAGFWPVTLDYFRLPPIE
jgi:prepilin-type N-terminal cleavage/methylation domain-containing protein